MWYKVSHFDWALANRVKNSDAKQLEIYLVIIAAQFYMDIVELYNVYRNLKYYYLWAATTKT